MDQDKKVTPPKYTEHYKDVEKRKEYMRKYQLDRYYKKKALKNLPPEDTPMNNTPSTPANIPETDFQKAVKGITTVLGPEDPVSKIISKAEPFIPYIQMFLQGFVDARNAAATPQQHTPPGPQAPPGWNGLSALDKLTKKYNPDGSISSFWQQGMYYDQWANNAIQTQQLQSHMPVDMEQTYHGNIEATRQRRLQMNNTPLTKYNNMQELNTAAEREEWDNKNDLSKAQEVERTDGQPASINEAIKTKNTSEIDPQEAVNTLEAVKTVMQEDAKKYLNLVVMYFKTRPIDQFEQDLMNIDVTIEKYRPMIELLPFQARETFKQITVEDLEAMIKEQDPAKHALIVKKKLKKKLSKLWDELKNGLNPKS